MRLSRGSQKPHIHIPRRWGRWTVTMRAVGREISARSGLKGCRWIGYFRQCDESIRLAYRLGKHALGTPPLKLSCPIGLGGVHSQNAVGSRIMAIQAIRSTWIAPSPGLAIHIQPLFQSG